MPYKIWQVNEILTAADMNTYVGNQTILTFAGTAARGSAIGTATEGMVSYLDDSNQLEVFDGSNWVGLAGASVGTATPATTAEGDFWLDTNPDGQVLKAYNSGWKNVGPVSGNAIINGDFGVWQRGTSFTDPISDVFVSDRWKIFYDETGSTRVVSRETLSPGEIPGENFEYFIRYDTTVAGSGGTYLRLYQSVEDVRTYAGQEVTVSFYIKADSARTVDVAAGQNFGSGGSAFTTTVLGTGIDVGTTWQRVSATGTVASIAGKTVGANSFVQIQIRFPVNTVHTFDVTGVQVEAGSVATPFRLAGGGSKAAELALCQRYYQKSNQNNMAIGNGLMTTSTVGNILVNTATTMRTTPSITITDGALIANGGTNSSLSLTAYGLRHSGVGVAVTAGASLTINHAASLRADVVELDAEL